MRFSIENQDKINKFVTIFKNAKMICKEVNISVKPTGLYVQGMDSAHVAIFELYLMSGWFTSFECKTDVVMGVYCEVIGNILNCLADGQILKWSYMHDSSEELLIYFENCGMDKMFEVKLMDIDEEQLAIPDMEYDVDLKLNSIGFEKIMNQLNMFGETLEIECGKDDTIYMRTDGDAGKMQVRMKEDDIIEYAYDDEVELTIRFSLKYLAMFSKFSKLNSACSLHMSRNQPIKMMYALDSWMEDDEENDNKTLNYFRFYLAPEMDENDDNSDSD
jgi:proliferating cell nuclear antigen